MIFLKNINKTYVAGFLGAVLLSTSLLHLEGDAAEETTPNWSREDVTKLEMNDDQIAPEIDQEELEQIAPDLHVWDTWPLRDKDGSITKINGWTVIFSLTAPSDVLPGQRHDIAEIGYFYSRNGHDWNYGGEAFDTEDALGSRQWAGSAMYDGEEIHHFYTATGRKDEEGITYEQRMAHVSSDVEASPRGISFTNEGEHNIILEPDGDWYQTEEQSDQGDINYAFRDPWFFEDPETEEHYLVYEGTSAGTPAERACSQEHIGSSEFQKDHDVPEDAVLFNGNIGIAVAEDDSFSNWEMQAPIFEADCVNQELERPHIVTDNGQYYLFINTHEHMFAPGVSGPEGLYGFSADSLKGQYEPLNDSGLVIANPEDQPFQAYSWMVMPNGDVISFVNWTDLDGLAVNEIGEKSAEFQMDRFGGTLAPTLKISLRGDETKIVNERKAGHVVPSSN